MKTVNQFLGKEISFDPGLVDKIESLAFINKPDWCRHGMMSTCVIQKEPWVLLMRGIPFSDSDLGSNIGIASGESLNRLEIEPNPIITPNNEWDYSSVEDPTYSPDKKGFYYSGVVGMEPDVKCNLCFSDMNGNSKLVIPYGKNVDMIKELEEHRGKYFTEIGDKFSYIARIKDNKIIPFLEPRKETWFDHHTSTGPISTSGIMCFNGSTNQGKQWAIGLVSTKSGSVLMKEPIIQSFNNICFSSDLIDRNLFFHFNDKKPLVAKLTDSIDFDFPE